MTAIDIDMLTDPGGIFLGEGALQFPWTPSQIEALTIRGVGPSPLHTARRYWLTDAFTEATGDFQFTVRFKMYSSMNTGTIMSGFFDSSQPLNYKNFIGLSLYYSIVNPAHWLIMATYAEKDGDIAVGSQVLVPITTLNLRMVCSYVGRTLSIKVYNDDTSELYGTSTLNIPVWFESIDLDSFGFGNWDSPVGLSEGEMRSDINSAEADTNPSGIKDRPFWMGVKP